MNMTPLRVVPSKPTTKVYRACQKNGERPICSLEKLLVLREETKLKPNSVVYYSKDLGALDQRFPKGGPRTPRGPQSSLRGSAA
ncbi:hypothetical protein J6590_108108, partial [Homalodisca vitripennis]